MLPEDGVFNFGVWFLDGHKQTYKVVRSCVRGDFIYLKAANDETYCFRLDCIAGFSEPSIADVWDILEEGY